jgi:hypothetical protein
VSYVIAGYGVTIGGIVAYTALLLRRARVLRRSATTTAGRRP